jgi:hypothetical protein
MTCYNLLGQAKCSGGHPIVQRAACLDTPGWAESISWPWAVE